MCVWLMQRKCIVSNALKVYFDREQNTGVDIAEISNLWRAELASKEGRAVILDNLTQQQIEYLRKKLDADLARRIRDTSEQMRPGIKSNYADIVGTVPDIGDDAVADTLIDTDNAIIGQNLQQVRDITSALERLESATYGICIACGGEIDFDRLSAYPTAKRCIACQRYHEKMYMSVPKHTL